MVCVDAHYAGTHNLNTLVQKIHTLQTWFPRFFFGQWRDPTPSRALRCHSGSKGSTRMNGCCLVLYLIIVQTKSLDNFVQR